MKRQTVYCDVQLLEYGRIENVGHRYLIATLSANPEYQ